MTTFVKEIKGMEERKEKEERRGTVGTEVNVLVQIQTKEQRTLPPFLQRPVLHNLSLYRDLLDLPDLLVPPVLQD